MLLKKTLYFVDKNNLIFDLNERGIFLKKRTDAGYAVKLVIISAFFESFIFCSALETFFSSGTKMQ
ncbi:hypothetical protein EK904_011724, partial [Melospiza melodia maxima]